MPPLEYKPEAATQCLLQLVGISDRSLNVTLGLKVDEALAATANHAPCAIAVIASVAGPCVVEDPSPEWQSPYQKVRCGKCE